VSAAIFRLTVHSRRAVCAANGRERSGKQGVRRVSNEARQLRSLALEAAMGAERLETATVEEMVNAERDFERAEVEAARSGIVPTMSAEDADEVEWDLHVEFDDAPESAPEQAPPPENVFQLELFLARVDPRRPAIPPPVPTRDPSERRTTPPPPDWDPVRLSTKQRA
jgi:hypothetical protein